MMAQEHPVLQRDDDARENGRGCGRNSDTTVVRNECVLKDVKIASLYYKSYTVVRKPEELMMT